jgi:hypothetical protein
LEGGRKCKSQKVTSDKKIGGNAWKPRLILDPVVGRGGEKAKGSQVIGQDLKRELSTSTNEPRTLPGVCHTQLNCSLQQPFREGTPPHSTAEGTSLWEERRKIENRAGGGQLEIRVTQTMFPWGSKDTKEGEESQKLRVRGGHPGHCHSSKWPGQHHGQSQSLPPPPPPPAPPHRPGPFWQAPGTAAAASAKFWPLHPPPSPTA